MAVYGTGRSGIDPGPNGAAATENLSHEVERCILGEQRAHGVPVGTVTMKGIARHQLPARSFRPVRVGN